MLLRQLGAPVGLLLRWQPAGGDAAEISTPSQRDQRLSLIALGLIQQPWQPRTVATVAFFVALGSQVVSAEVSGNLLKQLPDAVGRDGTLNPEVPGIKVARC